MDELSIKALKAAENAAFKEKFIQENAQTILKIASKSLNRFITTGDDEWSIALLAYDNAINTYSSEKGSFSSYSGLLIKRALIDYYRTEKKYRHEVTTSPDAFSEPSDFETDTNVYKAVGKQSFENERLINEQSDIKEEIIEVNSRLLKYGFSFYDIAEASPKEKKTKTECAKIISYVLDNEDVTENVLKSGRLPIKEISLNTKVSKKILDRYRKYLIMAIIILNGEYPLLADYLQYVRKEGTG